MLTKHSFLTFCLLALIFSEINCQFHGPHSLSSDAMSALTKPIEVTERFKRDISSYCVAGCSVDLQSNINSYFPKLNDMMRESENSPSYTSTFTQPELKTFCKKIFSPLDQCLSTCSESQSLSILENTMAPLKYLCHDVFHEFYNSLPCRNSVRNETISTCLNDVCKERKDAPRRFREAARNLQFTNDLSEFKDLLAENCRLVSCVVPCETQILKRKCDANAAKLTKDFLKIYSSSIDKIYKLRGLSWIYPRECTNMAADEHYQEIVNENDQEFGSLE